MPTTKIARSERLPGRFEDLVRVLAPQAIMDDVQYEDTVEMIDRLMGSGRLTKGQELYMETLVQLVQAYESRHYSVDTGDLSGVDALRHLLGENGMNASDLGRLLGVHASMGSKILKGERSLTVAHLRRLAERFGVQAELFME
ncbi:MAG: helix-turn-helix domain-containing protein [Phycisphaerae bacterium]|nr:helix-turn-helix domain-containing protein [Phycisphaerae bacterium]